MLAVLLVAIAGCAITSAEVLCTSANKELVGRVVFGEARGDNATGQLAVAWVVVNRVNNQYKQFTYPKTVNGVVYQKYGTNYEFNTMGSASHTRDWNTAKAGNSITYRNATSAASGALCGTKADPTTCAMAFCSTDPCSSTSDTKYAQVYNKQKIGSHWFVCQRPK